jgi:hypothetical protein
MGGERKPKRTRRLSDRKFVFDWDVTEDTSQDFNDLYTERRTVQMFGRGHLAGIDIKEQLTNGSKFYQQLLEQRRSLEEKSRAEYHLVPNKYFIFHNERLGITLHWSNGKKPNFFGMIDIGAKRLCQA